MSAPAETEVMAVAAPSGELQAQAAQALTQPATVDKLVERVELVKAAMQRCMVEGQHYGTVPGTKKPSLWKPGAELLGVLFQLGQRYRVQERLLEGGHIAYTVTCAQFFRPTGADVSEGVGAASTREYKYRVQTEPRVLENGKTVPAKYTPFDFYNTALKMACKRSLVAATINASGVSEIFTQDTEDNPDLYREQDQQQPPRQPHPKAPKPSAKANGKAQAFATSAPTSAELVTGFVSRVWDNTYQDKRYWFAKLDQGQQIQTSDPELGAQLMGCETGEAFRAWCEPSPKPNKFYLKSFEQAPAEAGA